MDQRPSDVRPAVGPHADGEQNLEAIRADMEGTRAALAGKLETLQERVADTIEQTVESVQETVEKVKRALDIPYQTQQHPWLMVGAAFAAGAVVGGLTVRPRSPAAPGRVGHAGRRRYGQALGGTNGSPEERSPAAGPAPRGLFAEEWDKIKSMAVGAGMALAREWLKQAAPRFSDRIEQVMDSVTQKLGGEPVQGPPFEPAGTGSSRFDGLQ